MMMNRCLLYLLMMFITQSIYAKKIAVDSTTLLVKKTADFNVNGEGTAAAWATTSWVAVTVQESTSGKAMTTEAKVLYSDRGLYFLFVCHDEKLTTTLTQDNVSLWKEDVVEVFLWPDEKVPLYFEYELSPMNFELPLLIPNLKGRVQGWLPWYYQGDRKTKRATSVQGGVKKSNATVKSWTAEFFIPYKLLDPLVPSQPKPGTTWRANLYRIDYDHGADYSAWQHTSLVNGSNFHEYERFGTFLFE